MGRVTKHGWEIRLFDYDTWSVQVKSIIGVVLGRST